MFSAFQSAQPRTVAAWLIAMTDVGACGIVAARSGEARINSGLKRISKKLTARTIDVSLAAQELRQWDFT